MPRLRQVPRAEVTDERVLALYRRLFGARDPVREPGTATGTRGDWWTVFALSPDVFAHAVAGFALYRDPRRRLDPILRELGQTRAGWARGSQFVYSQHCKSLRALGVPEAKITAIPAWSSSPHFSEIERAILAYADALVLQGGRTPEALFESLKGFWSDEEILEFTYVTCLYEMHATMARALRLEFDDRDDPVMEIAAPEDFQGTDFLDARPAS